MQFQKKTRAGNIGMFGKIFIKIILVLAVLYIAVVLVDKIDFPSPNKIIEKKIPNENFKVVK
tara:strand:- start:311 stop:496 length:186 start_codon:yes stop_codon:yes gene_type:complete